MPMACTAEHQLEFVIIVTTHQQRRRQFSQRDDNYGINGRTPNWKLYFIVTLQQDLHT